MEFGSRSETCTINFALSAVEFFLFLTKEKEEYTHGPDVKVE